MASYYRAIFDEARIIVTYGFMVIYPEIARKMESDPHDWSLFKNSLTEFARKYMTETRRDRIVHLSWSKSTIEVANLTQPIDLMDVSCSKPGKGGWYKLSPSDEQFFQLFPFFIPKFIFELHALYTEQAERASAGRLAPQGALVAGTKRRNISPLEPEPKAKRHIPENKPGKFVPRPAGAAPL